MILVDYREDGDNKAKHKGKRSDGLWDDLIKTSLPVQQDTLDGGDLMFLGQGPEGKEVSVGIEFKKIRDLLSSLRSQRFQGHQLFELQPYDFRFLLIEGEWRHNDAGQVVLRSGYKDWSPAPGGFSAAELDKTLLGLVLRAGVVVKETHLRRDTVRWIESTYRNFTDKAWDEHSSHTGLHRPSSLVRPSPFCDFIAGIPGIGLKRARAVERFFDGSPRQAIAARAETWARVDGIGKRGAATIDDFLEGN